jgi:hypothetical protein
MTQESRPTARPAADGGPGDAGRVAAGGGPAAMAGRSA